VEIIEEIQDDISIYRLKGRLDSNTSQGLEEKLFEAISDGSKRMIVDFKDLNYISSDGIRVILISTKAIKREEGQIVLCCMRAYVKEVFEIAGLGSLLPVVATMKEALKAF
jgi:anti-sigma B factor antagonist